MSSPRGMKFSSLSLCGGMPGGLSSEMTGNIAQKKPSNSANQVVLVPNILQAKPEMQSVQQVSLHPLIWVQGCHLPGLVELISFLKQSQLGPDTR